MRRTTILAVFVALCGLSSAATAAFNCKPGAIVQEGQTKTQIRLECGPPMSASYEGVIRIDGKLVYLDRWVYNPGVGGFYQILEFHDGVLTQIKDGPRVQQ